MTNTTGASPLITTEAMKDFPHKLVSTRPDPTCSCGRRFEAWAYVDPYRAIEQHIRRGNAGVYPDAY